MKICRELKSLYAKEFDPFKFDKLWGLLGGIDYWKREMIDGEWEQYWFETKSGCGVYVTTERRKISCINVFDENEDLVVGYQGRGFYNET